MKSKAIIPALRLYEQVKMFFNCYVMLREGFSGDEEYDYVVVLGEKNWNAKIYIKHNSSYDEYWFILLNKFDFVTDDNLKNYPILDEVSKKVRKISGKKISDWCNFLINKYNHFLVLSQERAERVRLFKSELPMPIVTMRRDDKLQFSGYIENGGLRYEFSIHLSDGSITETIDTNRKQLKDFLLMSDNKLNQNEKK